MFDIEELLRYALISKPAGVLAKGVKLNFNGSDYVVISQIKGTEICPCECNVLAKMVGDTKVKYVVCFKGSVELEDWLHDLMAWQVKWPFSNYGNDTAGVSVHYGFIDYYKVVRDKLLRELSDIVLTTPIGVIPEVTFCGHSLGGALASIALLDCKEMFVQKIQCSGYTYGSPRVFNATGSRLINIKASISRVTNKNDIVPNLPWWSSFKHVGQVYHILNDYTISQKDYYICPLACSAEEHDLKLYINSIQMAANLNRMSLR